MERKENKLSHDSLDNHNDVADVVGDFFDFGKTINSGGKVIIFIWFSKM